MADWRDVMEARSAADDAQRDVDRYGGTIEDGGASDQAMMLGLVGRAIVAELRALAVTIDYNGGRISGRA